MSNDMKLIMENWRVNVLIGHDLWEEDFDRLLSEMLQENVLTEGRMLDSVKASIKDIYQKTTNWAEEKLTEFVKSLADRFRDFLKQLRSKKLLSKYQHREEQRAINLLTTEKHISLAVGVFTAIYKMSGGFTVDQMIKAPETLKALTTFLTTLREEGAEEAFKVLLGDVSDILDLIKQFTDFRKDLNSKYIDLKIGKEDTEFSFAENKIIP